MKSTPVTFMAASLASEPGLERVLERVQPEGALEPGLDPAVGADDEQPRLGLKLVGAKRRAEALLDDVVDVDLLMDELDAVAVLLLELGGDVDDRPAYARLA